MVTVETTVQKEVEIPGLAEPLVRRAVRRVLAGFSELDPNRRHMVSVTFVHEDAMRELNRAYRGMDSPTDVLSFPLLSDDEGEMFSLPQAEDENHLGDVVICPTEICPEADLLREIAFLACHGTLHLVGCTHCTPEGLLRMNRATEHALAGVFPPGF